MAITTAFLCLLGFAFVDDANIIHSGPSNTTSGWQVLADMQHVLDHWDGLLRELVAHWKKARVIGTSWTMPINKGDGLLSQSQPTPVTSCYIMTLPIKRNQSIILTQQSCGRYWVFIPVPWETCGPKSYTYAKKLRPGQHPFKHVAY